MRLFGIPIRVHGSFFFLAGLLLVSGLSLGTEIANNGAIQIASALLLLLSLSSTIVVHELAHALMARRYKILCESITLFLLGGAAHISSLGKRPGELFWIAFAGPLASFLFCIATLVVLSAIPSHFADMSPWSTLLVTHIEIFGFINLILGGFNLLMPIYPLDGGRIAHSILWKITGDEYRGRRIAIQAGRVMVVAIFVVLIYLFIKGSLGLFNLLWFSLLGIFILFAQKMELKNTQPPQP